jgi:toxin ParE1/3/4
MELEIESQMDLLIEFPEMGRQGRVLHTRELIISRTPYFVVYRVRDRSLEILRVLHGAQKWP